jgi:hypothetical protein
MKNIHILPTDKSSKLFIHNAFNDLRFDVRQLKHDNNQHIYITSDEETKENTWCFAVLSGQVFKNINHNLRSPDKKKIILTTDQELINDGVQAIDDTFLEWLVKNPTCEKVEVVKEMYMPQSNGKISDGKITHELSLNPSDNTLPFYKIIIQQGEPKKFGDSFEYLANVMSMANFMFGVKEEPKLRHQQIIDAVGGEDRFREIAGIKPKQETLEEAAVRIAYDSTEENKGFPQMKAFINGAKWQAERMYTEEDMLNFAMFLEINLPVKPRRTHKQLLKDFKNK